MPRSLHRLLRPRSYGGLLTVLMIVIVISPLLEAVRLGGRVLEGLFVIALVSAMRDVAGDERRHYWIFAIGAVAIASRSALVIVQPPPAWLSIVGFGSTIAVFLIATWSISAHVFRQRRVDVDTIRGAICIFLLLGIIWAMLFSLVFASDPAAFPDLDPSDDAASIYTSLQYFSFVTLTTLGYGDITPAGLVVRQLAMTEAIVGQLFIAVAIAWLVGMYRGENADDAPAIEERNDHESTRAHRRTRE